MRFHRLLASAGSVEAILQLSVAGLQAAEVAEDKARLWHQAFRDPGRWRRVERELDQIEKRVFNVLTEADEAYPSLLRSLSDRPPVLYYQGRWPPPESLCVGVVGTRHPT